MMGPKWYRVKVYIDTFKWKYAYEKQVVCDESVVYFILINKKLYKKTRQTSPDDHISWHL